MNKYNQYTDKIIELYKLNSMTSIAKILSIDPSVVKRILKENNIDIKKINHRKYLINENFFDNIDTEKKAYMLGFLFADGAVAKDKYSFTLSLAIKDKAILEKFANYIFIDNTINHIKNYIYKNKEYSKINFCSKYMIEKLINYGCTPAKSLTLQFPNLTNPFILRHFIKGYFDGDGSIASKTHIFTITSTLQFCQSIKDILYKYTKANCQIYKYKNIYRLTAHGRNKILDIFNWLYLDSNTHLLRKFEIYQNILNEKSKYFTKEQIVEFIKLREKGFSYNKIAIIYNCSRQGISKAIKNYNKSNQGQWKNRCEG